MSDDRYGTVPDYMANAFRNIDRHYKQRKTVKGKLEMTDYTNVIDLRDLDSNASNNHDAKRVILVATREGGFNGHTEWDWKVEKSFNKDWVFQPSQNVPVTGDGCPPKKKVDDVKVGNNQQLNDNGENNINVNSNDHTTITQTNPQPEVNITTSTSQQNESDIKQLSHVDSNNPTTQTTQPTTKTSQQEPESTQSESPQQSHPNQPSHTKKHHYQNPNKKKNNKYDQYIHPFKHYRVDNSGQCGSSSSKIYAIDQVPGLFVISRCLHYSSQIVWALRCLLTYEKDYTNLYNLHFVLPEKGVKDGLETLPDQTNLPEELKVNSIDDIQELFVKACANAIKGGLLLDVDMYYNEMKNIMGNDKNVQNHNENVQNENQQEININSICNQCPLCKKASTTSFTIHSHYKVAQELHTSQSINPPIPSQQSSQSSLDPKLLSPLQSTSYQFPSSTISSSIVHHEDSFNLTSLKRLRWASLGYHYDWTDREYADDNKSPFPLELYNISQLVIQPLVEHGIVTPLIPEAGIINYYPIGTRMGAHIDDAELAVECPIVSFSAGLTSLFIIGNKSRKEEPISLFLRSGDVLIQDGISRLAFHSVPRIVENSIPFSSLYIATISLLDQYYQYCDGISNNNNNDINQQDINHTYNNDLNQSPSSSTSSSFIEPATADYIPNDTFQHFIQLIQDIQPLLHKYTISIEQLLTFILHILCEYRINFNTRQVQDPKLGSSLSEVRQKFPINAVKAGVYEGLIENNNNDKE